MNLILKIFYKVRIVFLIFTLLFSFTADAQKKTAFLQFSGNVSSGTKKLPTAQLQVFENGSLKETIPAKENGSWIVTLDLGKEYILVYSCPGYVSKSVEVNTLVPPDAADISYVQKFNMELNEDIQGLSKSDPMNKPIARWKYTPGIEDFDFDPVYTKRIKDEQALAAREAAAEKLELAKARLDSLNKLWNDSIARAKEQQSEIASQNAAIEKAKQDSILKAQTAAAAFTAAEIARVDAEKRAEAERRRQEEIAMEKAKQDSINTSNADLKKKQEEEKRAALLLAQEKARQDSISRAEASAELKRKQEEEKAAALLLVQEKARQDSISKAEANAARQADMARQKQMADSMANATAQAEARKKLEADSIRKVREAEALALKEAEALRQKATTDSIANAKLQADARKKEIADSTAKAQANTEARKKAEADSTRKVREAEAVALKEAQALRQKEIADSTANAKAMAEAKKKEAADSTAKANAEQASRQKAIADELVAQAARNKYISDSTSKAQAEAVRVAAVQAKMEEDARKKSLEEEKAKARKDSTDAANAEASRKKAEADALVIKQRNDEARKKLIADSTAYAEAAAAKAKADADEEARLTEMKRVRDSIDNVSKAEKDKAEAERMARIQEDIQAKKDALARANQVDTSKSAAAKSTTAVPKIRESDYQEGITDEKVNESNRSIVRTVVKKDGVTTNYQKITYNWGGIFYFKNEQSVTATLFDQEINIARKSLSK
jgi:hypothetical protein